MTQHGTHLQQEGVLLVRDLQRRGAPHVPHGAARHAEAGLRRLRRPREEMRDKRDKRER